MTFQPETDGFDFVVSSAAVNGHLLKLMICWIRWRIRCGATVELGAPD